MNILAFDTSTETMSVAILAGSEVVAHTGPGGAQSSISLIPAIQELMKSAGLAMSELDAIAFGRGPGSFTGLRTACAVAQGLAFGANIPVLPVNTLLIVAEEARHQLQQNGAALPPGIVALLDARMDEVYLAHVEMIGRTPGLDADTTLARPEMLHVPSGWAVAGNVFGVYAGRFPAITPDIVTVAAQPNATALLRLAPELMNGGFAVPAALALPLYIRDKVAKTTIERLAEKQAAESPPAPRTQPIHP